MLENKAREKTRLQIQALSLNFRSERTPEDRTTFTQRLNSNLSKGKQKLKEAKAISVWIPNLDDREKMNGFFATALANLAGPGNPKAKIITTLLAAISFYSLDSFEKWHKMHSLILEAEHHFELADFYQNCLENT